MAALETAFEKKLEGVFKQMLKEGGEHKLEWPTERDGGVIGYCHGMNMAIMHCKLLGGGTPYEIAVGTKTAKLASCFGCTTFMYANGYPPSFIHIGKAESWTPIAMNKEDNPEYKDSKNKSAIDHMYWNWADAVAGYMKAGAPILVAKGISPYSRMARMLAHESATRKDNLERANIFLDALTISKSEWDRLKTVLRG